MRARSALVVCLVAWRPAALVAQGASPYVPLHHWAMPYVEHLVARGVLADPAPLSRPLHADDLVRALEATDSARLNNAERRIVRDIVADLRPPQPDRPWLRASGEVTAAGASHARRDPLRAAGPGHATAAGGLDLQLALGRVMLVTHPYFDTRLKYDPDYFGKKDRFVAGRNAEAYGDARFGLGAHLPAAPRHAPGKPRHHGDQLGLPVGRLLRRGPESPRADGRDGLSRGTWRGRPGLGLGRQPLGLPGTEWP